MGVLQRLFGLFLILLVIGFVLRIVGLGTLVLAVLSVMVVVWLLAVFLLGCLLLFEGIVWGTKDWG